MVEKIVAANTGDHVFTCNAVGCLCLAITHFSLGASPIANYIYVAKSNEKPLPLN